MERSGSLASRLAWVGAIVIWSVTATVGAQSMQRIWNAAYMQWSPLIPVSDIGLDKRIETSSKVAVVGMRSFPLVGPTFARRTYDNVVVEPPTTWLAKLRRDGVSLLVAAGESGSVDEPGFLQPLPAETRIAKAPGVCKLATHGYVRVYGLDEKSCSLKR